MNSEKPRKTIKIGLLGLGTVGQALIRLINTQGGFDIVGVSARTRNRERVVDISPYRWFDDARELATHPDIDVFVEVAGGLDTAYEASLAALQAGKHLVTANKAMLAERGNLLIAEATGQQVSIGFEAAVCGAIPAVKVLRETLAGNHVQQVQGIFNGTCNYIFALMGKGIPFADALRDAQEKGFAEADPTLDIGGGDAAHKTALMANLISGQAVPFDQVHVEGISDLPQSTIAAATANQYTVKLLGQCKQHQEGCAVWVYPAMIRDDHPLAKVHGVTNAVSYQANAAGFGLMLGPGAGGEATASSAMSDLVDIAGGRIVTAGGLSAEMVNRLLPITARVGANWVQDKHLRDPLLALGAVVRELPVGLMVSAITEESMLLVVPNEAGAWLRVEGEEKNDND